MSVAAVVLAAGASRRLGQPKQLVLLDGETLLERSARVAREAGCEPVVVVLGAYAGEIRRGVSLEGAGVIVNEQWNEGMASSIRAGIRELSSDVRGCVLMTCDMPAVTAEHLRRLASSHDVAASSYAGRRGVPAYFSASAFGNLLALQGDAGARELLRDAAVIELSGGELDIDTVDDLRRLNLQTPQAE